MVGLVKKLFYWNAIKLQQLCNLSRCCINIYTADEIIIVIKFLKLIKMEVYCFGCGSVLDKSTDRRKLVSTAGSSNRVFLVWKTLLLEKVSITSEKIR